MIRTTKHVIAAASAATVALTVVAIAETEEARKERCAAQSGIVVKALAIRADGTEEVPAMQVLAEDTDIDPKYAPAIPALVGWVYDLTDEQREADVAAEFQTACEGYAQ